MAKALELEDVDHYWGGDLVLSPTGDLARVAGAKRSEQRVLRRLMTNPGEYLPHQEYGGGLPGAVGSNLNLPETRARIRGQMLLERAVAQTPEPTVQVEQIPTGVSAEIRYIVNPGRQPVGLSFDLEL